MEAIRPSVVVLAVRLQLKVVMADQAGNAGLNRCADWMRGEERWRRFLDLAATILRCLHCLVSALGWMTLAAAHLSRLLGSRFLMAELLVGRRRPTFATEVLPPLQRLMSEECLC